jgi:hypothetical protein
LKVFFQNITKLVEFTLEEQSVPKVSQFFGPKKAAQFVGKKTLETKHKFVGGEVSKSFIVYR